jgi:hypothetical protein
MPNWQPKWDDVQFDHGEANEAVALCQSALVTLGDRHAVLQGPYQLACTNWRGLKRMRFDAEWSAMHAHAESVAEQLRAHIVRLQRESSGAIAEQRLREAERARWFTEKAVEEAAAAAAREAQRIAAAQQAAAAALASAQAAQRAAAASAAAVALSTATQTVAAPPALIFAAITSPVSSPSPVTFAGVSSSGGAAACPQGEPAKPAPTFSPAVSSRASGQMSGR